MRYSVEPVKRYRVHTDAREHCTNGGRDAEMVLTMMLVIATNARMKVMYVFVRLNEWSPESVNVFAGSPPPKIATSSRPCATASAPDLPCAEGEKGEEGHSRSTAPTQGGRSCARSRSSPSRAALSPPC